MPLLCTSNVYVTESPGFVKPKLYPVIDVVVIVGVVVIEAAPVKPPLAVVGVDKLVVTNSTPHEAGVTVAVPLIVSVLLNAA